MGKSLATHLEAEYKQVGNQVIPKGEVKVHIKEGKEGEKSYDISKFVWVLANTSKSNKDLYVSCTKILKHSGALYLKRMSGLKFVEGSYTIHKTPDNDDIHGYATIMTEKGTLGDGEVHKRSLQPSMYAYPYTMLKKRTEDRAILQELGLYELGFYSDAEITPEMMSAVDDIPLNDNKKVDLVNRIRTANAYLNQSEAELVEFVSATTGNPTSNIDIDSMSVDVLARIFNKLKAVSKEEMSRRIELVTKIMSGGLSKSTKEELMDIHSSELEKTASKKK